jgi:hypothetical protein
MVASPGSKNELVSMVMSRSSRRSFVMFVLRDVDFVICFYRKLSTQADL